MQIDRRSPKMDIANWRKKRGGRSNQRGGRSNQRGGRSRRRPHLQSGDSDGTADGAPADSAPAIFTHTRKRWQPHGGLDWYSEERASQQLIAASFHQIVATLLWLSALFLPLFELEFGGLVSSFMTQVTYTL